MHLKIPKIETNANEVKFSNEKLLLFYLIFAQIEIIEIYRQKGKAQMCQIWFQFFSLWLKNSRVYDLKQNKTIIFFQRKSISELFDLFFPW